jgi:hypothetical protein
MGLYQRGQICVALLGILACNRSPLPADTDDDGDCPKPIEAQSQSCGDQEVDAGEFCHDAGQAIELVDSQGSPQVVLAELVVADFDTDGKLDLLTGNTAALGDGQGSFDVLEIPRLVSNPRVGEFDGEPGVDVVYMYNIEFDSGGTPYGGISFLLSGPGYPNIDFEVTGNQFGSPEQGAGTRVADLAVGDYDGNGRDDIAVHTRVDDGDLHTSQLWMLTHDGSFNFDKHLLASNTTGGWEESPSLLSTGRLGPDAADDLVWEASDVLLGGSPNPSPAFNLFTEFGFVVTAHSMIGVTLDCDDHPDSLMPASGRVLVLHGQSASPYLSIRDEEITVGGEATTPLEPWDVADLNNDGAPDILLIGDSGVFVSFATESSFGPATSLETPHPWIAARAADIDGNGRLDIVGIFDDLGGENGGFEIMLGAS